MNQKDFTNIARYCNDNWKGKFSDQELNEFAKEYYDEYKRSKGFGIRIGSSLDSLVKNLIDDYRTNTDADTCKMIGDWLEDIAIGTGFSGFDPFSSLLSAYGVSGY